MISKKDALEFPFLKESQKLAKTLEIEMNLDRVYSDPEMVSYVDEYLSEIYHNRFYMHKSVEDLEVSLKRFMGACIVANRIGVPVNIRRFALFESKYHVNKLESKNKEMFPIYFNILFEEVFGRPNFIEKTKDGNYYAVKVPDFLKFKRKIDTNPEYALVNQAVINGYVIIGKEPLLYILQVGLEFFLQEKVKDLFGDIPVRDKVVDKQVGTKFVRGVVLPPLLSDLVKKFEYVDLHVSVYKSPPNKDTKEYDIEKLREHHLMKAGKFPPCMAFICRRFDRGENVSHFERLTIATFLLARGDPISSIVDAVFSKAPNFDKKKTEYQLQQIKKGDYKTPNCLKILNEKLCFRNDICGSCHNPLQLLGEVNM